MTSGKCKSCGHPVSARMVRCVFCGAAAVKSRELPGHDDQDRLAGGFLQMFTRLKDLWK